MNTVTGLRISAKNLGCLALPDACERCFWLKATLGFKLPYQIFPGIFSSIDSYSKAVTHLHHARQHRVPAWLDGFGELGVPLPVPHHTKFRAAHPGTGATLTGVPDELLKGPGGLWILDYKTARFTATQDELLPMYVAQLNGYALIAEALGYGPVAGLGLVYYEPVTDVADADLDGVLLADGFRLAFRAKLLPIPRDAALVPGLLARAKAILDAQEPPPGRTGCRDCEAAERLVRLLSAPVAAQALEAA